MPRTAAFTYKIASIASEFEQIHRLNYRTFVEEIPQRAPNASRRLVDAFHTENTYLLCLRNERLVGMLAVRANRPFSLDGKLTDLDSYLPPGRRICEIRLLAVERCYWCSRVFTGLVFHAAQYCQEQGYDLAVISGTVRQLRLYRHLGFVTFGPLVGAPEALFQPMYLTLETFQARFRSVRPSAR